MKNAKETRIYTIPGQVVRETEKAILLTIPCTDRSGHRQFDSEMWFPKSVCQLIEGNIYQVADWFARKMDMNAKAHAAYIVTIN